MKPLEGIVVLDLTRLLPGAVASQTLADFGARVVKVEEPTRGDYAREMPPLVGDEGALFLATNAGKMSVAIDLKREEGREALLRLAARADVLLEGFRPGVMERLGLGYEALSCHNERLIYVSLTGYGQRGPYAGLAGHDLNYLSLSGVLDLVGPEDAEPAVPGVQFADLAGGAMQAVTGVLLALMARSWLGRGQMVDVSMLDGAVALLAEPLSRYELGGEVVGAGVLSGRYACYNLYRAGDGRWLSVGALEPKFWAALCRALGCEQFITEQFAGGARQAEIIGALRETFRTRRAREWLELLAGADACVAPVKEVPELAADEHLRRREMVVRVAGPEGGGVSRPGVTPKLSHTPGAPSTAHAPRLGEHTREVLLWAGLTEEELSALEREGVVRS